MPTRIWPDERLVQNTKLSRSVATGHWSWIVKITATDGTTMALPRYKRLATQSSPVIEVTACWTVVCYWHPKLLSKGAWKRSRKKIAKSLGKIRSKLTENLRMVSYASNQSSLSSHKDVTHKHVTITPSTKKHIFNRSILSFRETEIIYSFSVVTTLLQSTYLIHSIVGTDCSRTMQQPLPEFHVANLAATIASPYQ